LTDYLWGTRNKRCDEQSIDLRFKLVSLESLKNPVHLKILHESGNIGRFLRGRSLGFAAFHAALSAQFKVFLFVLGAYRFRSLAADFAGFGASLVLAEGRNVRANIPNVLRVEDRSVSANQEAEFSGENAGFDVLDSFEHFFPEFFPTNLQAYSLLSHKQIDAYAQ